jgi:hypothetical protein
MKHSQLINELQRLFEGTPGEEAAAVLGRVAYTPETMESAKSEYRLWLDLLSRREVLKHEQTAATQHKEAVRGQIRNWMVEMALGVRASVPKNHPLIHFLDLQTRYARVAGEDGAYTEADTETELPEGDAPVETVAVGAGREGRRHVDRSQSQGEQLKRWLAFSRKLPLPAQYQAVLDTAGWTAERLQEIETLMTAFTEALARQKEAMTAYAKANRQSREQGEKMHRWHKRYNQLVVGALVRNPTHQDQPSLRVELGLPAAS